MSQGVWKAELTWKMDIVTSCSRRHYSRSRGLQNNSTCCYREGAFIRQGVTGCPLQFFPSLSLCNSNWNKGCLVSQRQAQHAANQARKSKLISITGPTQPGEVGFHRFSHTSCTTTGCAFRTVLALPLVGKW